MMPADVALVLCTRNRAFRLQPALNALARAIAAAPNVEVEVVLVDSASTDATSLALSAWAATQPGQVKILRCDRPGVCLAKNTGIQASEAPLIVTTDDDCLVDAAYFANVVRALPPGSGPGIVGGRIDLGDPQDLPITIKPDDKPGTFKGKRMPTGFIMGANLAATRSVFENIGLFDEAFGPGAELQAAEDTELLVRAMLAGFPISYNPSFRVAHFHGRKTVRDGQDLYATYSFGDGAVWGKYLFRHPFVLRSIVFCVRSALREIVFPSSDAMLGKRKAWWRLKRQIAGFRAYSSLASKVTVPTLSGAVSADASNRVAAA